MYHHPTAPQRGTVSQFAATATDSSAHPAAAQQDDAAAALVNASSVPQLLKTQTALLRTLPAMPWAASLPWVRSWRFAPATLARVHLALLAPPSAATTESETNLTPLASDSSPVVGPAQLLPAEFAFLCNTAAAFTFALAAALLLPLPVPHAALGLVHRLWLRAPPSQPGAPELIPVCCVALALAAKASDTVVKLARVATAAAAVLGPSVAPGGVLRRAALLLAGLRARAALADAAGVPAAAAGAAVAARFPPDLVPLLRPARGVSPALRALLHRLLSPPATAAALAALPAAAARLELQLLDAAGAEVEPAALGAALPAAVEALLERAAPAAEPARAAWLARLLPLLPPVLRAAAASPALALCCAPQAAAMAVVDAVCALASTPPAAAAATAVVTAKAGLAGGAESALEVALLAQRRAAAAAAGLGPDAAPVTTARGPPALSALPPLPAGFGYASAASPAPALAAALAAPAQPWWALALPATAATTAADAARALRETLAGPGSPLPPQLLALAAAGLASPRCRPSLAVEAHPSPAIAAVAAGPAGGRGRRGLAAARLALAEVVHATGAAKTLTATRAAAAQTESKLLCRVGVEAAELASLATRLALLFPGSASDAATAANISGTATVAASNARTLDAALAGSPLQSLLPLFDRCVATGGHPSADADSGDSGSGAVTVGAVCARHCCAALLPRWAPLPASPPQLLQPQ